METGVTYHYQTALQVNWLCTFKKGRKMWHLHKGGWSMDLVAETSRTKTCSDLKDFL